MKAYRFDRHGGPEVLRFEDVSLPEPGPGEVRIRHSAVALNFRDILVRRGQHSVASFPSGLGVASSGKLRSASFAAALMETDGASGSVAATFSRIAPALS